MQTAGNQRYRLSNEARSEKFPYRARQHTNRSIAWNDNNMSMLGL